MNKEEVIKKFTRNKYSYLLLCFNSGISSITSLAVNYYFKDKLKIEPSFLSQIMAFMRIPYMLKPVYGLLTDMFPIFGYRRKFYIIISALLCSLGWLIFSLIKLDVYQSALCLFIINVNLSFSTVLSQAIFVEIGKLTYNGELVGNTKDLVSVYFIVKNLGLILAATLKGILIEIFSIETVFLINSLNQTIMLLAGIILIEDKVSNKEEENKEKLLTSSTENNENESKTNNSLSTLFEYIFQSKILIPYFFVLIFLSTPVYTETMFYYCSNILKLTPNKFGIIQTFQMGGNLLIVFIYKNFISKRFSFKQTLTLSRIVLFLTLLPNYFLVNGYTQKYINDFYIVLITTSSNFILTTVASLPVFNLAAKLSPKNLEGTVYAIFVSAISLGQIDSTLFGSWLTKIFNITANNFENMSKLIVSTNIIMLIPLPLMYLIPTHYFEPKDVKKENEDKSKEGKELESK